MNRKQLMDKKRKLEKELGKVEEELESVHILLEDRKLYLVRISSEFPVLAVDEEDAITTLLSSDLGIEGDIEELIKEGVVEQCSKIPKGWNKSCGVYSDLDQQITFDQIFGKGVR